MLLKIAENKMPRRPTQLKYNDFVHKALTSRGICFGQQCVKENTMRSQWTKIEQNLRKKINTPSVRINASMKLSELKNLVKRYKVKGASQLTKPKLINKLRNEFKAPPTRANLEKYGWSRMRSRWWANSGPNLSTPVIRKKNSAKSSVNAPRLSRPSCWTRGSLPEWAICTPMKPCSPPGYTRCGKPTACHKMRRAGFSVNCGAYSRKLSRAVVRVSAIIFDPTASVAKPSSSSRWHIAGASRAQNAPPLSRG